MDKERERFARLAERAKQPPFTPLDNLLKYGSPDIVYNDPYSCGCWECVKLGCHTDQRVIDGLRKMRGETEGPQVEREQDSTQTVRSSTPFRNLVHAFESLNHSVSVLDEHFRDFDSGWSQRRVR